MQNKEAIDQLRENGIKVDNCRYMLNDALEDNDDMEQLFLTLERLENKPVITANFLTSNPDFEKIKASNFLQYFNENLFTTLAKSPNRNKVEFLYREGIKRGCFIPQLHGREHLNVSRWMSDLQNGNEETMLAFELRVFGVSAHVVKKKRESYQAAFDEGNPQYKTDHSKIVEDAVVEFGKMFQFKPVSFIAPNYTWGEEIEAATFRQGIKYLQGTHTQRLPKTSQEKRYRKRNTLGSTNHWGQNYLIRNCSFEPFSDPNRDWISHCLEEIKIAFLWKKPAIISMHRANFVGSINPENREKNLKLFSELIKAINIRWPEVEFMSSNQLGKLMDEEENPAA